MLFLHLINYINLIIIVKNLNHQSLTSVQFLKDYHDIFDYDVRDLTVVDIKVCKPIFPFIFQIGACCRLSDKLQYCIYDEQN